jgi:peptide chain release factor 2
LLEQSALSGEVSQWKEMQQHFCDFDQLFQLYYQENDETALGELAREVDAWEKRLNSLWITSLLDGEHDKNNAFVTIHPGAGGTESQDWVQMLLRMYLRWAEGRKYKTQIVDLLPGEEAGIKSVTFMISGEYAYGYIKTEAGVHRLVRISPFDSNHRRHTSFASVFVYPEVNEDIDIEIKPEDLRIDTFRSSGAGGQHVNVTDSAVRIVHLPTGIVSQCQNERSQHRNRDTALKVLRARLYEHYQKEKAKYIDNLHSGKKEIAWGSQIRSYVFQPYQLVKDHRSGIEVGDVQKVVDGDVQPLIEAFLLSGM